MKWLLSHMGKPWPYQQIDAFDEQRFFPILFTFREKFGDPGVELDSLPEPERVKPLFFPHDGIPPFWQFTLGGDLQ